MSIDASIVMPAYNRAALLKLTLVGFEQQDYPHDKYEVILVDDGSVDDTEEIVASHCPDHAFTYIKQPNQGRSAARNLGIRQAQGKVVIMNDAEAIPSPHFVSQHMKHHTTESPAVVLGKTSHVLTLWDPGIISSLSTWHMGMLLTIALDLSHSSEELNQKVRQALRGERVRFVDENQLRADFASLLKYVLVNSFQGFDPIYETYSPSLEGFVVPWFMFVTVNVSAPRNLLLEVGLFDEEFSGWGLEDSELGYRLLKAGGRYLYEKAAINYHQLHQVSANTLDRDLAANYKRFCEKFPTFEVFQYWRRAVGNLSAHEYNEIVKEYQDRYEVEGGPAAVDYLRLAKGLAYEFIRSSGRLRGLPEEFMSYEQ